MLFRKILFLLIHHKDITDRFIVNTAVMITLFSFVFMISGCSYYRSVTRVKAATGDVLAETINALYPKKKYPRKQYPESNLEKLFFMNYNLIAVDSSGRWILTEAELINDTLYALAVLSPVTADSMVYIPQQDGISVRYNPSKERDLLKMVFVYAGDVKFNQAGQAYFPKKEISKIIVLKDYGAKKTAVVFIVLGGLLIVLMVGSIIYKIHEEVYGS